jgi:hypothetical protein
VRLRLALIASATLLLAAGCGQQSRQRPAVARYVKQVNAVEARLTSPLASITQIGASFARRQGAGGSSVSGFLQQATIAGALQRIASLRGQLASVKTPPPAAHLRSLLLQVIDAQIAMTRQLAKMVVFLPRFSSALAPLTPALRRLEAVLSQQSAYGASAVAAVYAAKAAALRAFRKSVEGILARLRELRPPAVAKPDLEAEAHSLRGMGDSAGKLATALEQGPQGNTRPLLTAFGRAAASAQSPAARRAHATAIKAYDRQIARISSLSQDANLERLRLANSLA